MKSSKKYEKKAQRYEKIRGLGLLLLTLFILGESPAEAQRSSNLRCESLNSEIQAMQEAQKVLMHDLVGTNDNMATTLDRYAEDAKTDQRLQRSASAIEAMDIKRSAEAFRQHKKREQSLVAKFEMKSQQLLNKVESCLRR